MKLLKQIALAKFVLKPTAILVCLLLLCAKVSADNLPDFRFVSVTGAAEQEVKPDYAKIQVQTLVFDSSSDLAVEKSENTLQSVLKAIELSGIRLSSIEASDIRKREKRQRNSDHQQLAILGYEVTRSLQFRLDDLERYSDLINQLNAIDFVMEVEGRFDSSQRESIGKILLMEAGEAAREKADLLAKSLGVEVEGVQGISQEREFYSARISARFHPHVRAEHAMLSNAPSDMTVLIPDTIRLHQWISVVFRLR